MMGGTRVFALFIYTLTFAAVAWAQQRPSEEELFGRGAPDAGRSVPSKRVSPPGQARPSEEDLFGASAPDGGSPSVTGKPAAERLPPSPAPQGGRELSRDERALSAPASSDLFATEPTRDNPLTIGGQIYLRAITQATEDSSLDKTRFLMPAIVDGYFDARPSDRVRGMILGRLTYDPTLAPSSTAAFGSGSSPGGSAFTLPTTSNPAVLLDQLWVNFDIARTVYVTAGRQHVKWGVSRFWNPTDFLSPQRRDPLAVFDPRLGASMVKVHLPSESHGWNLYAIGLADNAGPASTLGQLGGAVRVEKAFRRGEVGMEAVLQPNRKPRFGFDASSAIGPVDAYVELVLRKGVDRAAPLYRLAATPDPRLGFAGLFESYIPTGVNVGVSGGLNHTFIIGENNDLVVGAEYFYNSIGYENEKLYLGLLVNNAFQPFYIGRHYGALFATFTSPSLLGENGSFILSNLSNLSDRSVISRLDFLTRVLSYLYLEAYVAVHYGRHGGEFRLQGTIPAPPDMSAPPIVIRAPLLDAGVGVRIKI